MTFAGISRITLRRLSLKCDQSHVQLPTQEARTLQYFVAERKKDGSKAHFSILNLRLD